jgi:hypothetical protein
MARSRSISVPGGGDSVLNYGKAPWIVCLEDGVVVRRRRARGESIINDVAGNKLIAVSIVGLLRVFVGIAYRYQVKAIGVPIWRRTTGVAPASDAAWALV